jgi:hypothetical protein
MPTPTAEEILNRVHTERPRGWRRFTIEHARQVEIAIRNGSSVGSVVDGAGPPSPIGTLSEDQLQHLANRVRTNNGAVGFGFGTLLSYLAWKLVETAVWWAIKWAWNKKWQTQQ